MLPFASWKMSNIRYLMYNVMMVFCTQFLLLAITHQHLLFFPLSVHAGVVRYLFTELTDGLG